MISTIDTMLKRRVVVELVLLASSKEKANRTTPMPQVLNEGQGQRRENKLRDYELTLRPTQNWR